MNKRFSSICRKFLIFLLIIVSCRNFAQTINVQSTDGNPISSAVLIAQDNRFILADDQGVFSAPQLKNFHSNEIVTVQSLGYDSVTGELNQFIKQMTIQLNNSAINLEEIVVTAKEIPDNFLKIVRDTFQNSLHNEMAFGKQHVKTRIKNDSVDYYEEYAGELISVRKNDKPYKKFPWLIYQLDYIKEIRTTHIYDSVQSKLYSRYEDHPYDDLLVAEKIFTLSGPLSRKWRRYEFSYNLDTLNSNYLKVHFEPKKEKLRGTKVLGAFTIYSTGYFVVDMNHFLIKEVYLEEIFNHRFGQRNTLINSGRDVGYNLFYQKVGNQYFANRLLSKTKNKYANTKEQCSIIIDYVEPYLLFQGKTKFLSETLYSKLRLNIFKYNKFLNFDPEYWQRKDSITGKAVFDQFAWIDPSKISDYPVVREDCRNRFNFYFYLHLFVNRKTRENLIISRVNEQFETTACEELKKIQPRVDSLLNK